MMKRPQASRLGKAAAFALLAVVLALVNATSIPSILTASAAPGGVPHHAVHDTQTHAAATTHCAPEADPQRPVQTPSCGLHSPSLIAVPPIVTGPESPRRPAFAPPPADDAEGRDIAADTPPPKFPAFA